METTKIFTSLENMFVTRTQVKCFQIKLVSNLNNNFITRIYYPFMGLIIDMNYENMLAIHE